VLNLIIAEAALELIPDQIIRHPSVTNDAKRMGHEPPTILLDRSIHHAAMAKLGDQFKRGRPDLVHMTLLNATSTPLYQDGLARVYIHTRNDVVLEFREQTRPPKSYSRFRDLMRKSLQEMPESGLIRVYELHLDGLLKKIGSDLVVGLSIQGGFSGYEELASELSIKKSPVALVGGFPHGHFTPETTRAVDRLVRVDRRPLDAHVVVGRLIYEVEKRSLK
jgi:rRNA small subunit pseudouridine methyltransferase Nep1